jgi:hypothetical protein
MSDRALSPARALLHPLWLGACALLLVNDHVFKGAGIIAELATGKLSDFAGMIVAPSVLATLVRVRTRRGLVASHAAIAIGFALIQVAAGARLVEELMAPLSWRIWPDPTDLVALPMLALSWRVLVPAMARPLLLRSALRGNAQMGALLVGLLACLGTSAVPNVPPEAPPPPDAPVVAAEAIDLHAISGRWRNESDAGHEYYRFDGDRYVAGGHPAFHESGRLELVRSDDRVVVVRLVERVLEGQADEPRELTIEPSADLLLIDGQRYQRVPQQVAAADGEAADELVP